MNSEEEVRRFLGGHRGLDPRQLHKDEVAALIIRAGRMAGFLVRTEVPAPWARENSRAPAIDCGWYCARTNAWLVAWEFDGRDVGDDHLSKTTGNVRKFAGSRAHHKIQVLYSVKNDLTAKPASRRANVEALLRPVGVTIVDDLELMTPGGIARLIAQAQASAAMTSAAPTTAAR